MATSLGLLATCCKAGKTNKERLHHNSCSEKNHVILYQPCGCGCSHIDPHCWACHCWACHWWACHCCICCSCCSWNCQLAPAWKASCLAASSFALLSFLSASLLNLLWPIALSLCRSSSSWFLGWPCFACMWCSLCLSLYEPEVVLSQAFLHPNPPFFCYHPFPTMACFAMTASPSLHLPTPTLPSCLFCFLSCAHSCSCLVMTLTRQGWEWAVSHLLCPYSGLCLYSRLFCCPCRLTLKKTKPFLCKQRGCRVKQAWHGCLHWHVQHWHQAGMCYGNLFASHVCWAFERHTFATIAVFSPVHFVCKACLSARLPFLQGLPLNLDGCHVCIYFLYLPISFALASRMEPLVAPGFLQWGISSSTNCLWLIVRELACWIVQATMSLLGVPLPFGWCWM